MARRTALPVLLALAALPLGACGDDGDDPMADDATATTVPAGEDDGGGEVATVPVDDACELVGDAAAVTGLPLGQPVAEGDERRRVCAFSAIEEGQVGLTVGIQAGSRFDEKAEQSAAALGEGEPVEGLGDRALFFWDDADIPEGVGGVLVEVGDLTVDVTLQGVDEATSREAAVAVADVAAAGL